MSDRELLELAAKAAGIEINDLRTRERDEAGYGFLGLWTKTTTNWNPLTDDGDALRLAVKLGLFVDAYKPATTAGFVVCPTSLACKTLMEDHEDDPAAATRRAIVRAAAEIGRTATHQPAAHASNKGGSNDRT